MRKGEEFRVFYWIKEPIKQKYISMCTEVKIHNNGKLVNEIEFVFILKVFILIFNLFVY